MGRQAGLDVFLEGLLVDLAIPTSRFARGDTWFRWLNEPTITRYLADHGIFPNSKEKQEAFFLSHEQTRLILVLQTKQGKPRGIVSLSKIDWRRRNCDFAIFLDSEVDPKTSPLAALEATALIVEHAVEKMGIDRIQAWQHTNLAPWQQRLELVGFRLEGVHRLGFVKGAESADSVSIAATKYDISTIRAHRNGRLFDSPEKMLQRIKSLPEKSLRSQLNDFTSEIANSYYEDLFQL